MVSRKVLDALIISIIVLALSFTIIRHVLRADNIETDAKVIANVNGEDITVKDLFNAIMTIPSDELAKLGQKDDDSSRLLERLILDTLLLQEARRRGLDKSPDIQQKLENYKRELLITAVVKDELEKMQLDEDSTSAEKRPAVWARHIALKDLLTAQRALARLQAGEEFEKVAQELSIGTDRTKGGELGWVVKGEPLPKIGYEPKVEAALFALSEGEISDLIKTRTRIHIVKVEKKGVEGEEFNGQMAMNRNGGGEEKSISRRLNRYITKLKHDAKITIYSENMPKIILGQPFTLSTDELLEDEIE
ncbi:MAG: peptidylprolyl isomerase [Candidatus Poribacteria bacterium]